MNVESFPPRFYIIGAQKSGTTQLATLLDQHPGITLSQPKEPDFYTRYWSEGFDWYRERFPSGGSCLVDASTSYSCAPLDSTDSQEAIANSAYTPVPERIFESVPDARFIYIMRDPVKRTFSAYWHQVRSGLEDKPFMEAIQTKSYYVRTSLYAEQIARYLEYFPKENFLFLYFEDFLKDQKGIVNQCIQFMGQEPVDLDPAQARGQNKSFVYTGAWGKLNRLLASYGGLNSVVKKVKPIIPRAVLDWGGRLLTKPPPAMTQEQEQYLVKRFSESNKELFELVGYECESWKTK